MGLDWRYLSLSAYFEALEAHNEAHSGDGKTRPPVDPERLGKFLAAHGVGVKGGNRAAART